MTVTEALLTLRRLRVQNANAISSPLTWGFPSPSAFTGFVHALERRLEEPDLSLQGVAIVCHHFEPQASRPPGRHNQVFHLTRNPVGADGTSASLVEEGRAHLEVSLVVGASGQALYRDKPALVKHIEQLVFEMRLAGGSVFRGHRGTRVSIDELPGNDEQRDRAQRKLRRSLLPGFALVSREGVLGTHWASLKEVNANATQLDALLDLTSIHFEPPRADEIPGAEVKKAWTTRSKPGWFVPIPAGYQALSELHAPGAVKNARDRVTPFRFVEGLYTLGQWLSPHRVDDVQSLFWFHEADPSLGIYRCTTPHFGAQATIEGK